MQVEGHVKQAIAELTEIADAVLEQGAIVGLEADIALLLQKPLIHRQKGRMGQAALVLTLGGPGIGEVQIGTVIAGGNMLDEIADSEQTYAVFMTMEAIKGGTEVAIKNETGDIVAGTTIANDCTCLAVSSADLLPGTYTLWKGDEQLKVSEMNGRIPGMPGGGKFKPDGEMPKKPEFSDGEMPQPSQGMKGEKPMKPDGERPMKPDGEAPLFPGGDFGAAEAAEEFVIKEGANMFLIVM